MPTTGAIQTGFCLCPASDCYCRRAARSGVIINGNACLRVFRGSFVSLFFLLSHTQRATRPMSASPASLASSSRASLRPSPIPTSSSPCRITASVQRVKEDLVASATRLGDLEVKISAACADIHTLVKLIADRHQCSDRTEGGSDAHHR